MSKIVSFDFGTSKVRTKTIHDEPHFCFSDVCNSLELKQNGRIISRLNKNGRAKISTVDTLGRRNTLLFINESNLYKLIFRSNKPKAREFEEWVTGEVLPQIRKTGSYAGGKSALPARLAAPKVKNPCSDSDFYTGLEKLNRAVLEYGQQCFERGGISAVIKLHEDGKIREAS